MLILQVIHRSTMYNLNKQHGRPVEDSPIEKMFKKAISTVKKEPEPYHQNQQQSQSYQNTYLYQQLNRPIIRPTSDRRDRDSFGHNFQFVRGVDTETWRRIIPNANLNSPMSAAATVSASNFKKLQQQPLPTPGNYDLMELNQPPALENYDLMESNQQLPTLGNYDWPELNQLLLPTSGKSDFLELNQLTISEPAPSNFMDWNQPLPNSGKCDMLELNSQRPISEGAANFMEFNKPLPSPTSGKSDLLELNRVLLREIAILRLFVRSQKVQIDSLATQNEEYRNTLSQNAFQQELEKIDKMYYPPLYTDPEKCQFQY